MKTYLTLDFLMLIQSCITLTKTMHESDKLVNGSRMPRPSAC
jgi:hypothetical protein